MTQEHKDLLLKDLCARLPYGVKVEIYKDEPPYKLKGYDGKDFLSDSGWDYLIEQCKPYLFPLSTLTEEQWKEITDIQLKESLKSINSDNDCMSNPLFSIGDLKTLDWCYANHIDIHNLIPMDLAIDATDLNIY